jgi:hypothetical protein
MLVERVDDLARRLQLELAGASLSADSQPGEQLSGGLATGISVALEKRG